MWPEGSQCAHPAPNALFAHAGASQTDDVKPQNRRRLREWLSARGRLPVGRRVSVARAVWVLAVGPESCRQPCAARSVAPRDPSSDGPRPRSRITATGPSQRHRSIKPNVASDAAPVSLHPTRHEWRPNSAPPVSLGIQRPPVELGDWSRPGRPPESLGPSVDRQTLYPQRFEPIPTYRFQSSLDRCRLWSISGRCRSRAIRSVDIRPVNASTQASGLAIQHPRQGSAGSRRHLCLPTQSRRRQTCAPLGREKRSRHSACSCWN